MNIYKESTQFKNWIFNKQEIDKLQVSKFEKGLKILTELQSDIQQIHPQNNQKIISDIKAPIDIPKQQPTKVMISLKSKI